MDFFSSWKGVFVDYSGKLQRAQIDCWHSMFSFLKKLLQRKKEPEISEWPSVVLLLREQMALTDVSVMSLAQKVWGLDGGQSISLLGSTDNGWVISLGRMTLSIQGVPARYDVAGQQANETTQRPWDEHRAWLSVDAPLAPLKMKKEE